VYAFAGILVFGHDAVLLETRRLILKRGGFQVWIATTATDAVQVLLTEPIELFILCQSLSPVECEHALEAAHTLRPDVENLIMRGDILGLHPGKKRYGSHHLHGPPSPDRPYSKENRCLNDRLSSLPFFTIPAGTHGMSSYAACYMPRWRHRRMFDSIPPLVRLNVPTVLRSTRSFVSAGRHKCKARASDQRK